MVPTSPQDGPAPGVEVRTEASPSSERASAGTSLTELFALGDGATGTEPAASGTPDLVGAELAGQDLSGRDLSGLDLTGADLAGANLKGAKLRGTVLSRGNLEGADLLGADLEGAVIDHAALADVNLTRTNLRGANFARSDLRRARLYGARLHGANFERVDLRGGFLGGVKGYEKADWRNCDIRDVDLHGTYLARRFIGDQNYLHEFRSRGPWAEVVYRIWWATSDCGRSALRWGLLTTLLMLIFAQAYHFVDIDYGSYETWLSPVYFSVVTITTLGYGDSLPMGEGAQLMAMCEVIIGYVMLGGLLSIFSTKMARRAE